MVVDVHIYEEDAGWMVADATRAPLRSLSWQVATAMADLCLGSVPDGRIVVHRRGQAVEIYTGREDDPESK